MSKDTPTYDEALAELNQIVLELEQEVTSIDDLSGKVKRAAFLVNFCKEKLRNTEAEVKGLLEE